MSTLSYSAAFVRMGRSPFGDKPKEVAVFAQCLGGLTIFTKLTDPAVPLRIWGGELAEIDVLMSGFALAETAVPLDDEAAAIADRLRREALHGDLKLQSSDAFVLADAVASLDVSVVLSSYTQPVEFEGDMGEWNVVKVHAQL